LKGVPLKLGQCVKKYDGFPVDFPNMSKSMMAGARGEPFGRAPRSAQPPEIVYSGGGAISVMAGHIFVEEFLALLLPHTTMDPRFRFQIREYTFDSVIRVRDISICIVVPCP